MQDSVETFFNNQLDFILFFYGLAFILLGLTSFAVAMGKAEGRRPWMMLGLFGLLHGFGEWLDLSALVIGDTPVFGVIRTALMSVSFIMLAEFARQKAVVLGYKPPDLWIYFPILLLICWSGFIEGASTAGILARYTLGLGGAWGSSWVFMRLASGYSGAVKNWTILAAIGFALYGVAAGLIVPAAPFWPASELNYIRFTHVTGIPIQLVRGLLACGLAYSIFAIWGYNLISEVASERYTAYVRRQFVWTLTSVTAIFLLGWTLTQYLGGIYERNVREETKSDMDLLVSRLVGQTATVQSMAEALAGSQGLLSQLYGESRKDEERTRSLLDLHVRASGAKLGYILDTKGTVVASSDRQKAAISDGLNYRSSPYFKKAMSGEASSHFALDVAAGERAYYASDPVRDGAGKIVGVAVLKDSLDNFEADLMLFNRPYFFVNPDGVVVLTNRPKMLFQPLWPQSVEKRQSPSRQSGYGNGQPVLKKEVVGSMWSDVDNDGERDYVLRRYVNHSQWSMIILKPTSEIFASRVLGIIITLLSTIMVLIYILGRERGVHDHVQMEKRLRLQQLAQDLRIRAITDSLTGLYNRAQFDETLSYEMLRSERYKTSLSMMIFDIDNFKGVNDSHGHQTGDKVLVQLTQLVAGLIRNTDCLARWGGEEFILVVPESDSKMAVQTAEKLRDAISRAMFEGVGTITCSFGVAQYRDGETAQTFISRADIALYKAKINGRNRVELAWGVSAADGSEPLHGFGT